MAKTIQLLKQVRNTAAAICSATDNARFKALLAAADVILNTLMLQDSLEFYRQYLAQGRALLKEGQALASQTPPAKPSSIDVLTTTEPPEFDAEIRSLHQALAEIIGSLDEGKYAAEKSFLVRVADWEGSLYTHNLESAIGATKVERKTISRESLQGYLRRKFPEQATVEVKTLIPLDGGFSKQTILFETEGATSGPQSMVIRAEQPVNLLCYEGSRVAQEFHMIQLMQKAGLPIAEPLWLESNSGLLGTQFIVSRKASGKTYGGNLGSDEALSPELVQSIIATFIKMHRIKVDPADPLAQQSHLKEWLPHRSIREATLYCVKEFMPRLIRLTGIPVSPLLVRGLKWLEGNIPDADEPPVVIHIDFALNNLIIDNDQITAVLDWESSRLGDPAEDIIWTQQNLAAYITMPEFLKLYAAGTGLSISPYRLAYCRVSRCALNAITCLSAMQALDHRDDAPINLGILAYKYMAIFGTQFNSLIADAENLRG